MLVSADIAGQILATLVPPPAPFERVNTYLQITPGGGLALGVQGLEIHRVILIAADGVVIAVTFGHLQTHPMIKGVKLKAAQRSAEITPGLEYPAGKERGEHTGGRLGQGDGQVKVGPAFGIQTALENPLA